MNRHASQRHMGWALLAAPLLCVACATSSVTGSWSSTSFKEKPLKNIVVYVRESESLPSGMQEFALSDALSQFTNATPWARVFGDSDIRKIPKAEVRDRLLKDGFDGLLVAGLTSVSQQQNYVYVGAGWGGWWGPWSGYSPGFTYVSSNYYSLATLYEIDSGKMVWRAETEVPHSTNRRKAVAKFVTLIQANLHKAGVASK